MQAPDQYRHEPTKRPAPAHSLLHPSCACTLHPPQKYMPPCRASELPLWLRHQHWAHCAPAAWHAQASALSYRFNCQQQLCASSRARSIQRQAACAARVAHCRPLLATRQLHWRIGRHKIGLQQHATAAAEVGTMTCASGGRRSSSCLGAGNPHRMRLQPSLLAGDVHGAMSMVRSETT